LWKSCRASEACRVSHGNRAPKETRVAIQLETKVEDLLSRNLGGWKPKPSNEKNQEKKGFFGFVLEDLEMDWSK
jgi:hypothetical protein